MAFDHMLSLFYRKLLAIRAFQYISYNIPTAPGTYSPISILVVAVRNSAIRSSHTRIWRNQEFFCTGYAKVAFTCNLVAGLNFWQQVKQST